MKKLFVLGFLVLFLANCNTDDTQNCDELTSCTEIWVTLFVEVKDDAGVPVILDSYQIIDANTSEDLRASLTTDVYVSSTGNRFYPIYNDGYSAIMRFENRALVFKGYIGNQEIVSADFVVTADCCHVSLVSGNPEIIVN